MPPIRSGGKSAPFGISVPLGKVGPHMVTRLRKRNLGKDKFEKNFQSRKSNKKGGGREPATKRQRGASSRNRITINDLPNEDYYAFCKRCNHLLFTEKITTHLAAGNCNYAFELPTQDTLVPVPVQVSISNEPDRNPFVSSTLSPQLWTVDDYNLQLSHEDTLDDSLFNSSFVDDALDVDGFMEDHPDIFSLFAPLVGPFTPHRSPFQYEEPPFFSVPNEEPSDSIFDFSKDPLPQSTFGKEVLYPVVTNPFTISTELPKNIFGDEELLSDGLSASLAMMDQEMTTLTASTNIIDEIIGTLNVQVNNSGDDVPKVDDMSLSPLPFLPPQVADDEVVGPEFLTKCFLCPFASADKEKAKEHLMAVHGNVVLPQFCRCSVCLQYVSAAEGILEEHLEMMHSDLMEVSEEKEKEESMEEDMI